MTRQPTPDVLGQVLGPVDDTKVIRAELRYDYSLIPAEQRDAVQAAAVDIVRAGRRAQDDLMMIGQLLIDVKERLEHGQFEDWCQTEFQMTARTARNMMNVAKVFGDKSETVSVLSDSAMYLLAAPSTPDEARVEVIEQAQATGKSPTKAEVQETINRHKPQPTPVTVTRIDDAAEDTWRPPGIGARALQQEAPAARQARPTLSEDDLGLVLRYYWSYSELMSFAASAEPARACRSYIAQLQKGAANENLRMSTSRGEVEIWLRKYGEYRNRPADGIYTYDRWASLTISLLPQLLPPPTGRPLMEVLKTDDEIAAEAEAADIASRNAAADEAERQHQAREAAVLTPDREARAVVTADAAFGMAKAPSRNERIDGLLHIFQGAVDALPEVGELTGHYTFTTALLRELNKTMQVLKDNKIGGYKANA